jgi:MFS transporter, DHA1 family, inner membrane transport protein
MAATTGIFLGCVALLMLGLQPLLLGALLDEHRLSVAQLTQSATVELLVLGATAGVMGAVTPHRRLRLIGALGCAILVAGNAASMAADGVPFVACRALAGLGGGILVWIAVGMITHGRVPARLSGIFLAVQTAAQAMLAALLPVTLMPAHGANGGFLVLSVISALSALTLPLLPASLPDLPQPEEGAGGINLPGIVGLASSFCFMSGIVGLWVFIDPLAHMDGISPAIAQYAVALALAAQVMGALAATVLAHRLPPGATLLGSGAGCLAAIAVLAGTPGDAAFMAAVLLFGFLWLFTLPFQIPLLIRADPTRRAAMLLAGAQLLGGSAGPQITGLFATETALRPALAADAALFGLCILLTAAALVWPRPVILREG